MVRISLWTHCGYNGKVLGDEKYDSYAHGHWPVQNIEREIDPSELTQEEWLALSKELTTLMETRLDAMLAAKKKR